MTTASPKTIAESAQMPIIAAADVVKERMK